MRKKHAQALKNIFHTPILSNIKWSDIEALFRNFGAQVSEGKGSRVRVFLNGKVATFHRSHSQKETDKGAVGSVRQFLKDAGVNPEEQNV